MATKASAEVTVTDRTDATAIRAWYHAQTSAVAPSAPTTTDATATPSGWTLAEPTVSSASDLSKYVYRCEQLVWGDGTCDWGTVTLSASYEAAKVAYNEAQSAKTTATRYITDITDGIFVAPEGQGPNDTQTPTGWRIKDALELIKSGVSAFRVWLEDGMAKVRIGESDGNHALLDGDSFDIYHDATQMAHFGYGEGAASSGTGTAPYYTLGVRRSTTAAYDPSSTYAVGDHVVRNGTEYVCTVAIPTAEPWSAGHWTSAIGNYSAVDGFNATAGGYCSHAEGYETTASGPYSHAEGRNTAATGSNASHAEGRETMASGTTSHAEGYNVTASGIYSHAEGASTTASNYATHAEGGLCEASGWASHAEGYDTTASGNYSHAQNVGTVAAYSSQTAIGKYNDNQSTNAFEIGNGTSDSNRSNAFAVDWSGNIEIAGTVKGGLGEMLPSKRNNADSATNLYQYAQIGGNRSQTFDMTSNMLTIFARRGTVWGIWIVTVWDSPLLAAGNGTNITVTFNSTTKVATVSNGNSSSIVVTAFS